ncbi:MAG: cytochrome c biogenesis heme-transporting ATPase CcmA [Gammaproteobacteria bacterium]|nr:cytochrome c biogenesis heme-transporting ATPase CcmA [Gammaproteobacteria bacterium]
MESGVFKASNLTCYRGEEPLFRHINIELGDGDILEVAGENGSGKTSLLRILCGLSPPDDGEVSWRGQPLCEVRNNFFLEMLYVGHQNGLKDDLTPLENLALDVLHSEQPNEITPAEALEKLQLRHKNHVLCRSLSAGQKRRVALARLLLKPSKLWILDEPINALDKAGRAAIKELIQQHSQEGGITIYTTHFPLELKGTPQVMILS